MISETQWSRRTWKIIAFASWVVTLLIVFFERPVTSYDECVLRYAVDAPTNSGAAIARSACMDRFPEARKAWLGK